MGATGFGGAATAGAVPPLLLFALILGFFLLGSPRLGPLLPIRLPGWHPASVLSRLERPG